MKKIFMFVAALAAVSCNEVALEDLTPSIGDKAEALADGTLTEIFGNESLTIAMGRSESSTRVSVDTSGEVWNTTWDSGDIICGFFAPGEGESFSEYGYLQMIDFDPEVATFEGAALEEGWMRRLYSYPGFGYSIAYVSGKLCSYVDLSTQEEGLKYTHLISASLSAEVDAEVMPTMYHVAAAADLNIRFTNVGDAEYSLTSVELLNVPVVKYISLYEDYDSESICSYTTSGTMAISVDPRSIAEYSDASTQESVKFNVHPFDVAAGGSLSIRFTFSDDMGRSYTTISEVVNESSDVVSFVRGTYNTINSICDMSTLESNSNEFTLSEISASNIPSTDNWYITDTTASTTDFAGFSAAISALSTSGRSISVTFANLEAIPAYAMFGTEESSTSFASSALSSVTAPAAKSIGDYAFYYASSLSSVSLPEVESVGNAVFCNCSNLSSINLPSATTIGDDAFYYCIALKEIDLPEVTTIGSSCFYYCSNATSISLAKVEAISDSALAYCKSMTYLYAPEATTVGSYAIRQCDALENISLPKVSYIGDHAVQYCDALTNMDFPSLVEISDHVFQGNISLVSVSLPQLQRLDEYGFAACSALESVDLPEAINIPDGTFNYCALLKEVNLPSVTFVGSVAFRGCTALETLLFPSLEEVDSQAFYSCTALKTVSMPRATTFNSYAFNYVSTIDTWELCTDPGVELLQFGKSGSLFHNGSTANTTLYIGSVNADMVDGNVLSAPLGSYSHPVQVTFKEIIIVDNSVEDEGVEDFGEGSEI